MLRGLRAWAGNWERDSRGERRQGTWAQSFTGSEYWPIDPRPEDIHFEDMKWGLAREARYRGQTKFHYSVAQHSVLVSRAVAGLATVRGWSWREIVEAEKIALLHDAPEAWIGDVARPLKRQATMKGYRKVEALWWDCIVERYHLQPTPEIMELVEEVDGRIVLDEVQVLMADPEMWTRRNRYPGRRPLGHLTSIRPMTITEAAAEFELRFNFLQARG